MISYKEYKMLMETTTPTVSLGVTNPNPAAPVGNSFGFTPVDVTEDTEELLASLEEAKKKMFGDEMVDPKDAPPKDVDVDSEDDAKEDSEDDDDDDDDCVGKMCGKNMKKSKKESVSWRELAEGKKMKKMSGCGDMGDGGDEDEDDADDADVDVDDKGDDKGDMKMDLGGEEMMMKKKSKKEGVKHMTDAQRKLPPQIQKAILDKEAGEGKKMKKSSHKMAEDNDFFNSLAGQTQGEHNRVNKDGISEYLEDAVFTPNNTNVGLAGEPGPGEVGFAPSGKIGSVGSYEVGSEEQQSLSTNFMSQWEEIKDLALGVRENGLQDG